jgi:tetratricopeptide (TPR) repeat protein
MKKIIYLFILTLSWNNTFGQENISTLYMRLNRGETKELIKELTQMTSDSLLFNAELTNLLGDAYKYQFDYINALGFYNKVLKQDSLNTHALESSADVNSLLGQHQFAITNLKLLLEMDTNNFRIANKLAMAYQSSSKIKQAISIYRKLYTKNVFNYNTAKTLAECYWLTGNTDSSYYFYQRADFLNGKSTITKLNLSQLMIIKKDFNSAKIFASRAVELDSSNMYLRKQLGNCHYKLEEYKDAIYNLNYAVALGDSSAGTQRIIGASHYHSGEFKEAIPYLSTSLKTDSLNTEALFYLGASLNQTGKRDEAIMIFFMAYALLQPDQNVLYLLKNQMGTAFFALKRYEESYNAFQEAYQYKSDDIKLIYQMAMVRGEQKGVKNLTESLSLLKEYLNLLEQKGTTLSNEEVYLKSRAEWYVDHIKEELFMLEKK